MVFPFLLLWVVLYSVRGENVSNGVTLSAACLSMLGVKLDLIIDIKE